MIVCTRLLAVVVLVLVLMGWRVSRQVSVVQPFAVAWRVVDGTLH